MEISILHGESPVPQALPVGPYHQGWDAIAEALRQRLLSLNLTPKIHAHLKFVRSNPQTKEWKEEFTVQGTETGEKFKVHTMMVNRNGYPVVADSEDDDRWFTRRSDVEIYVFYSFPRFVEWQKNIDAIMGCLSQGDRTLDQTCLTYSLPAGGQSDLADFAGVDCHKTVINMTIEEAGEAIF